MSLHSVTGVMCHNGNDAVKSAIDEEHVDIRQGSPKEESTNFDPEVESLKIEYSVEQTLQALKKIYGAGIQDSKREVA